MVRTRCRNLTVRYPGADRDALSHLDLDLEDNLKVGILGASGAGKSTLSLALAGLIPGPVPALVQGTIEWRDEVGSPLTRDAVLRRTGIVTQDPWSQVTGITRTCADEVAFGLGLLGIPRDSIASRVKNALELLGISHLGDRELSTLSGGETQRLVLACLVALDKELLVLDQPTSHLDHEGRSRVVALMSHMAERRMTTVLTDDSPELAIEVCNNLVILNEGSLVAQGPSKKLVEALDFEKNGLETPLGVLVSRMQQDIESSLERGRHLPSGVPHKKELITARTPSPPVLSFRDVSVEYVPGLPVLRNVSFDIYAGERVALIGHNGAGKTTIARAIVNLVTPRSGQICILGKDLRDWTSRDIARHVGYAFQNPADQIFKITVRDEIAVGLKLLGLKGKYLQNRIEEVLDTTGLQSYISTHPYDLPDAKKRLLSIAIAIAPLPQILIIDEPTAGLDFHAKLIVSDIISKFAHRGVSIIAISHDTDFVAENFDRAIVLRKGTIRRGGPTNEILTNGDLLLEASLSVPSATGFWLEHFAPSAPNAEGAVAQTPATRAELLATLRNFLR